MKLSKVARERLVTKLEAQILKEREQMDHFMARKELANEQYYMGRFHALLNLKLELQHC